MKYTLKELIYYFTHRLPVIIKGKWITHNLVKVHWGKDFKNFGDCLQPYILRHYGLLPVYVPTNAKSDIVLQGSILQDVPENYAGYIMGTGGEFQPYRFPNAKIIALRGKITQANTASKYKDILLGDTGLLMSLVFPEPVKKKYELGIVPHFVDLDSEWLNRWKERFGQSVLFISPLQSVENVIKQIKSCKAIAGSSLHGLVVADSYHIPSLRVISRTTMPLKRFDYKYIDYYSAFGMEDTPVLEVTGSETLDQLIGHTITMPVEEIDQIISYLDSAMQQITSQFKR